jgi:hypothetical protein
MWGFRYMSTTANVRKPEQKITFFTTGKAVKLLEAEDIPRKTRHRSKKWLELFNQIPEGAAIAATRAEMGVSPNTVKQMVMKFKKDGSLSKKYYTTSRTVEGKETVYIVHADTEYES